MMLNFINNTKNKELIVRKRISSFLEKIYRYFDYDFDHARYKKIIYNEEQYFSNYEAKIKSYYDGIMYLLNNSSMILTQEILDKFFYIIGYKNNNSYLTLKIASKYFEMKDLPLIEKCSDFHLYVFENLVEANDIERLLIPLVFLNFCLVKEKIPCIHILRKDLLRYVKLRDLYFNDKKKPMYEFMLELLQKSKFQEKSYYKNLKNLTANDIKEKILNDIVFIKENFKFKHLYLYGSFCFNTQRIDSDIDFIIVFEKVVTQNEKVLLFEKFKSHYFEVFDRFVDLQEISDYLTDTMLKEFSKAEKIF